MNDITSAPEMNIFFGQPRLKTTKSPTEKQMKGARKITKLLKYVLLASVVEISLTANLHMKDIILVVYFFMVALAFMSCPLNVDINWVGLALMDYTNFPLILS